MSQISFENINWLLPLGLCGLIISVAIFLVLRRAFSTGRIVGVLFFRVLALACLLLALAGPYLNQELESGKVRLLVDVSGSMTQSQIDSSLEFIKQKLKLQEFAVTSFAAGQKNNDNLATVSLSSYQPDFRSQTDLEQALGSVSESTTLLISDGYETQGDLLNNLEKIYRGAVYPIIPESAASQSFSLEPLGWPHFADQGSQLNLSIGFQSAGEVVARLEVLQEQKSIYNQQFNGNIAETLQFKTLKLEPGVNTFEFVYSDNQERQIRRKFFINARLKKRMLLLSTRSDEEQYLKEVLSSLQFNIESHLVQSPENFPENSNELSTIIFNNVPLKDLSADYQQKLSDYVKEGGSFIMLGGNSSFGLGGYKDSMIADILPVEVQEPEKIKKRLNVAIQLVLDKSGSMKSSSKIDFTKLAAQAVINALKPEDYIGIIGFDSQPFIALEIDTLEKIRSKALARVGLLFPNGSTNLYAAMDAGNKELERALAGRKHMIILTDGELPDAGPMGPKYIDFASRLKASGITVSTFLIGAEDSQLIAKIAENGGGVFHRTSSPESLPKLFLEDLKVNTGDRTQKESAEYQTERYSKDVYATALGAFPPLLGYVANKKKSTAVTELVIANSEDKDPLLAFLNVGLGKTAAYTSDVTARWGREWLNWRGNSQFWLDVFNELQSGEGNSPFDYESRTYFKGQQAFLELTVYSPAEPKLSGRFFQSESDGQSLEFKKISKGRYLTAVNYHKDTELTFNFGSDKKHTETIKISAPAFDNQEIPRGLNLPFLYQLAETSGGSVNPEKIDINKPATQSQRRNLSEYFLLAGLFFLLLEIIIRERKLGL